MKVTCLLVFFLATAIAVPTRNEDRHNNKNNRHAPNIARAETEDEKEEASTTSSSVSAHPTRSPAEEQKHCSDLIGQFVNGNFEGLEVTHDLAKLLEKYGGPPGKVNATWTEKEDAPVEEEDLEKRPLPDADEKYWLYRYGDTDYKSYIRVEHAVRRFSNTSKAFLEVRGVLYFAPEDFCGKLRKADYVLDDRGFNFTVSRQYCWVNPETVHCAAPATCVKDEHQIRCIAAPSSALLASLVGK